MGYASAMEREWMLVGRVGGGGVINEPRACVAETMDCALFAAGAGAGAGGGL